MWSKSRISVKDLLKKTKLWEAIIYSDLYQKYKYPQKFKRNKEEKEFYRKFLNNHPAKNNIIFDVGANKGTKSEIFSKLAETVLAFEPSPTLYSKLIIKFKNTNVKVFNYALGMNVSQSHLYIVEENEAYNSLNKKHITTTVSSRGISTIENVRRERIRVEKIENFIKDFGLPKYIKIDVEGYEYEVIQGLKTAVPLLSFEVNLPEFLNESLKAIDYLEKLSSNKYLFNFATTTSEFLQEKFLPRDEAKIFLRKTKLSYLEVYAVLS